MNPCCAFDRVVSKFHTEDKVWLDLGYPRIPFTVQSWTNLAITTFLSWLAMLGHLQIASPKKCVFDSGLPTYFQNLTKTKVLDEDGNEHIPSKTAFLEMFLLMRRWNNLLVPGRVHVAGHTFGIASRIRKGRHGSRWEFGGGHRWQKPKKRGGLRGDHVTFNW